MTALDSSTAPAGQSLLRRGAAASGLVGTAAIHLVELPATFAQARYLGVVSAALALLALAVAGSLLRRDSRRGWQLAAALAAAGLCGAVIDRTVGFPGVTDDIGMWQQPLGLASLVASGVLALLSAAALLR